MCAKILAEAGPLAMLTPAARCSPPAKARRLVGTGRVSRWSCLPCLASEDVTDLAAGEHRGNRQG